MSAGARIHKRLGELKSRRQIHEPTWRHCFEMTYPLRADGFDGQQLDAQQGMRKRGEIPDSTGTDGCRILASGIMSGLTPANSRWFELDVEQATDDEKEWLGEAADTVWTNIHQSNFDAEGYEGCIDAVAAGWFVLYIDEAPDGGFSFQQWPISTCYVASTRGDGLVDTIYREHKLTAEAAAAQFGVENLSEQVQKLLKDKPLEMVCFVTCIEPRPVHVVGGRMAKNMPFGSYVVEANSKHLVRESGYHEFPCVVPRWMRLPNSAYGVGPAFDALPDMRMLNELKAMQLAAADIAIAGMWIAEDDGVLNPRTVKVGPRKVIVANSVESMKELKTGSDFQLAEYMVTHLQAAIRKIFMADQLQPQDGPAMTATEVHVRVELIRQLLGPIYGRLQAEYLRPMVTRCFGIAARAGVLGQPPESLADREYTVKYVSPLARAQRLEEVTAIERLVLNMGALAQATGDTSVFDQLDTAAAVRITAEGLGVPPDVLRSQDEVLEVQQAKQQAADQQRQAAAAEQMAMGAAQQAMGQQAAA